MIQRRRPIECSVKAVRKVSIAAETSDGAGLRESRNTATPLAVRGSKVNGFAKSRSSVTSTRCSLAQISNPQADPVPERALVPEPTEVLLPNNVTEGMTKLLLTSAGVKNTSIHDALVELVGKPIADSSALCIPTAGYGHPQGSPGGAWRFLTGQASTPMCELGWKSLGVLELTALPSIDEERWVTWVPETDVLLVNGGDALYLCHWMRQSGLADLLPSLRETVWVGLSAGSMVMAPNIGEDFVGWMPPTGGDETLRLVDFSIFPHLDHEDLPENSMAYAERWAADMTVPCYAIDDQTAIKVTEVPSKSCPRGTGCCFPPNVSH